MSSAVDQARLSRISFWLDAEWSAGYHNGAELWRRFRARLWGESAGRGGVGGTAPASRTCGTGSGARGAACPGAQPADAEPTRSAHERRMRLLSRASRGACRYWCRLATWSSASLGWSATVIPDALPFWIRNAAGSVLASFAKGVAADRHAIAAALTQPSSNGRTEGQSHQAETRAGADVRPRQTRSPTRPPYRSNVTADCTKNEPEPLIHADPGSRLRAV